MSDSIELTGPAFARVGDFELCYETFGNPTHPPLVLIMGLGAQMILWNEAFCSELARQGRWVVRFDNRDIGRSTRFVEDPQPTMAEVFAGAGAGKPLAPRYTLLDMAHDTIGLLDALGISRADVVGLSMGGAIAQEIALNFPERLRTVTFIMAPSGDPNSPPGTPAALANLVAPTPLEREPFVRNFVERWRVLAADHFPFDAKRTTWEGETTYARGINPPGVARQMLAIVASGNRLAKLHAVATPTLVIHGTFDPLVPFAVGLEVAKTVPGATLVAVEGMGHSLPREAWPQILEAIARHAPAG